MTYAPDIDIRDFVVLEEVMTEYGLGPNGAMILASDLMVNFLDDLKERCSHRSCLKMGSYLCVLAPLNHQDNDGDQKSINDQSFYEDEPEDEQK